MFGFDPRAPVYLSMCAVLVVMWQYLPKGWNSKAAVDLYEGAVIKALRKSHGPRRSYSVLEDNDPTGHKSNAAKVAKKALGIQPLEYPRYAPDLNPLVFFLWAEVERRMAQRSVRNESITAYKARLCRTAFSIPQDRIRKAVQSIKARARAVYDANGGDIPRD